MRVVIIEEHAVEVRSIIDTAGSAVARCFGIRTERPRSRRSTGLVVAFRDQAIRSNIPLDPLIEGGKRIEPKRSVTVLINRSADLGVPLRQLATTLRALVGGVEVAQYEEAGKRYGVRVRLEQTQRDDLHELERAQIRSVNGRLVDLSNVGSVRIAAAPARIDRQDRARRVTIFSNTPEGVDLETAVERLEEIVSEVQLPPGYVGRFEGAAEFRNPMSVLVIGGLLSSTFLTLLVVPVAYTFIDDLRALPSRLRSKIGAMLQRRVKPNPLPG